MCEHVHFSAKMDSSKEAYGEFDIIPLLTSNEPVSWEDLLDLENEKYVVSYFSPGLGLASPSCYYRVCVHREEKRLLLLTLVGICLCLNMIKKLKMYSVTKRGYRYG